MVSKSFAVAALAVSAAFAMAAPASATINAPVPAANYITVGSLDWAWAGPCAPHVGNSCNDYWAGDTETLTAFQAAQGWRIPTYAEFAARPDASAFAGACASAWFGSGYSHCDLGDPGAGYLFDFGYGLTSNGNDPVAETWFVRGGAAVPEPATWALMIGGFGLAGASLRRRRMALAA